MRLLLLSVILLCSTYTFAQNAINQFDANGKRHGFWKQTYQDQDQLRYEGTFKHGKEIGTFKHYKPKNGQQPSAILKYSNTSDSVSAKYFTKKGKLLSKGYLINRKRVGLWVYYHNDSETIMMKENYTNGKLNGLKTNYFDNGIINEEVTYSNDIREGTYKLYSEKQVLLQHLNYVNNELEGKAIYYNGKGEKIIEGRYKKDRKDGVWKYYTNSKLVEEKTFPVHKSSRKQKN